VRKDIELSEMWKRHRREYEEVVERREPASSTSHLCQEKTTSISIKHIAHARNSSSNNDHSRPAAPCALATLGRGYIHTLTQKEKKYDTEKGNADPQQSNEGSNMKRSENV
jgi:hypothetical protein